MRRSSAMRQSSPRRWRLSSAAECRSAQSSIGLFRESAAPYFFMASKTSANLAFDFLDRRLLGAVGEMVVRRRFLHDGLDALELLGQGLLEGDESRLVCESGTGRRTSRGPTLAPLHTAPCGASAREDKPLLPRPRAGNERAVLLVMLTWSARTR